jgi:hypothetical protein
LHHRGEQERGGDATPRATATNDAGMNHRDDRLGAPTLIGRSRSF